MQLFQFYVIESRYVLSRAGLHGTDDVTAAGHGRYGNNHQGPTPELFRQPSLHRKSLVFYMAAPLYDNLNVNRMILQKDEWKDVLFDGGFKTSYQFINTAVLVIQGDGYSNLEAEKQSVGFGNAILDDHLAPGQGYVMIQDWRRYKNSSSEARQYFIDSIVRDDRLRGIVFCNTSWSQTITINIAKTLKILKLSAHICQSLPEAVDMAEELLAADAAGEPSRQQSKTGLFFHKLLSGRQLGFNNPQVYIQDLLDYLISIDWKSGKSIRQYTVDPGHPMLPVFDAITFIKAQLDKTFQERNRIERQLVMHRNNLEGIVRQRTRALEESERHFKQLLDHSPVSIAVIEDNYSVSFINQKLTRTFGWVLAEISTPAQVVALVFQTSRNREERFQRWADAILSPGSQPAQFGPHEQQVRCKDGSIRTAEITATGIGGKIMVVMNDITKRKKAEARLEELAIKDELTSLYNRRHFMETLKLEFHRSRRYGIPLSMLMLDVDYFKQVNDTYGHPAGDRVLRTLAGIIRNTFRTIDTIFRIGGEEFSVILPETTLANAATAAERLKDAVEETAFEIGDNVIFISVSIGLATVSEATGSQEEFLKLTDDALYLAKNSGRNRIECL